jgi:hypothetical protein
VTVPVPIASGQAAIYELAFREAIRALCDQAVARESLTTGAGLLLSAAAIATSLLGGAALDDGPSPLSWTAIAAFVLLGLGVVLILWPNRDDTQFARPGALVQTYADPGSIDLWIVHRDLALHLDRSCQANRAYLYRLIITFRGCSALLFIEIILWVVDLIARG